MDAFQDYLEKIKGADFRKDPARTALLVSWMRSGDGQARNDLVIATLNLIARLAAAYCRKMNAWRDLEDLVQEANERVSSGIANYDPEKSSLESFVRFRARASFIDYWYRSQAINYTSYGRKMAKLVRQASASLAAALGREPTVEELAEHLDMDEERVQEFVTQAPISIIGIGTPDEGEDGTANVIKTDLPSADKSPFQIVEMSEARNIAAKCLGREDAELLLAYFERGRAYFQDLYFKFKHKRIKDAAARKYKQRLVKELRKCLGKKIKLSARGGNNGPQATHTRQSTQRLFKG